MTGRHRPQALGIRCRSCACNLDAHRSQAIARCINAACKRVGQWVGWR